MEDISYRTNILPDIELVGQLYQDAQLKRPIADTVRMKKMFIHSNLIVTAWHQNRLIGIARSMTDYSYWCYLADLAVASDYQNQGIGRKLLKHTKAEAGKDCMLLLLSAPSALSYYSKLGLRHLQNAFGLDRET